LAIFFVHLKLPFAHACPHGLFPAEVFIKLVFAK
jgi:hypothetical protein